MHLVEISDQKIWDDFVLAAKGQFLQSFEWGQFQERLNRKIWHLALCQDGEIILAGLVVKHGLPLNRSYLYSPRGPIAAGGDEISNFLERIREIARKENAIFWRIEPTREITDKRIKDLCSMFHVPCSMTSPVQPSRTIILDLKGSEEELLARMHPKTRYNIRLAQRHGIEVEEGSGDDIEKFLDILHKTARRDKFRPYPDEYYRQLFKVDPNFVKLYLARYKGEILAANIIVFFGKTATYVHGASSDKHRDVMAPHLLHWHVITEAKISDYTWYDFWGADEKKWPGLTRFKKSFGANVVIYPGTFDLILDKKWYCLYRLGKNIKAREY